ncbi:MAG TPA: TIGR02266 family protein [Spirochaetota bacterium]
MDNKRKSKRIAKKIKSQVSAPDSLTYSTSHNLSDGGVFISTPDPIAPGTELELSLKLPNGEFLNVTGIVRWTRDEGPEGEPAGMGVEFATITDSDVEKIREVIK